jgi:deoxyribonuclease V
MQLALDVHYREDVAKIVGVLFDWEDVQPKKIIVEYINEVSEYIPGEFYKRELPCIIEILNKVDLNTIDTIIIDGHIYVDDDLKYGLGGYVWQAVNEKIPIIGVAKTSFYKNKATVQEVTRGNSAKPLYVSSIGIDVDKALELIKNMKGDYRIPTILKELDRITKESRHNEI